MGLGRGPRTQPALKSTGYGIVAGREAPIPTPRHRTTLQTGFQKIHVYPYTPEAALAVTVQRPLCPTNPKLRAALTRATSLGSVAPKAGGGGE